MLISFQEIRIFRAFLLGLICLLSLSYILGRGQIGKSSCGSDATTAKARRSKTRKLHIYEQVRACDVYSRAHARRTPSTFPILQDAKHVHGQTSKQARMHARRRTSSFLSRCRTIQEEFPLRFPCVKDINQDGEIPKSHGKAAYICTIHPITETPQLKRKNSLFSSLGMHFPPHR